MPVFLSDGQCVAIYMTKCMDHEGNEFDSIKDMCSHYGIAKGAYEGRIKRGWELKEALTTPVEKGNNKKCRDHEGNEFNSVKDMCSHYGITINAYGDRIRRGWELKKALTTTVKTRNKKCRSHKGKCKDHKGNEFDFIKDMCSYYGITVNAYTGRIERGWGLEEALTTPVETSNKKRRNYKGKYRNHKGKCMGHEGKYRNHKGKCMDHEGNEFDSVKDMCSYYGIAKGAYESRIKRGWELKEALTTPVRTSNKKHRDHEGNEFDSVRDMCSYHGIKASIYMGRIRRGWELKEALTTPVKTSNKKYRDHEGNEFDSVRDMCSYHGTKVKVYTGRIKRGWELKEALTTPNNKGKKCRDHEGNEFDSVKDMCYYHEIDVGVYMGRIRRGWELKEALTTSVEIGNKKKCRDHKGNEFDSIRNMCDHYKIKEQTYKYRINNGYTKEESLGIIPVINQDIKNLAVDSSFIILKPVENNKKDFFLVKENGFEKVYFHDEIVDYYRENILCMKQKAA